LDKELSPNVFTDIKDELEEVKRFKVILLNDDYTTMDFVVEILMKFFDKSFDDALALMITVHRDGSAVCGIYPFEIAETKVFQVRKSAKESGYPLRAVVEEE